MHTRRRRPALSIFAMLFVILSATTAAAQTTRPAAKLDLFQATWNGDEKVYGPAIALEQLPPQFNVCLWGGLRGDVMPLGKTTSAQVRSWATLARYGGAAPAWCAAGWFPDGVVPPDTFVAVDCESRGLPESVQLVSWFKRYKPQGWTVWGIDGNVDLTQLASAAPATVEALDRRLDDVDQVLRVPPVLTVCCYVLGPGTIERDLRAHVMEAAALRRRYPGKKIYVLLWGCYHTAWNAENARIPDDELDRLVSMTALWFDGAIVWGERQGGARLMQKLAERSRAG